MRRADRLLQIVQILRRARGKVTASALAAELEVAIRTVYRDMVALQAARVLIEGEAGVGYVLRPGYDLPPMMFTAEELDAVALGARMVIERSDVDLARAARNVLAKVEAVVPRPAADQMWKAALLVPHPLEEGVSFGSFVPATRQAVRDNRKLPHQLHRRQSRVVGPDDLAARTVPLQPCHSGMHMVRAAERLSGIPIGAHR